MLAKLFGNKIPDDSPSPEKLKRAAMHRAIAEAKTQDPLAGVKIGAKDLVERLLQASSSSRGVQVESLLAMLGSLAGFSCQMAIRVGIIQTGRLDARQAFTEVVTTSNEKFYFGGLLNQPLLEAQYSIWSLAAGGAQSAGCKALPDIKEIVTYSASTIGETNFGHPRLPDNHQIADLPVNYVRDIWPAIQPLLADYCEVPMEWPILLGIAAQEVIIMGKNAIDPGVALSLIMECAVSMSKIDPIRVNVPI